MKTPLEFADKWRFTSLNLKLWLSLPLPPTKNDLHQPRKGGGVMNTDAYNQWIKDAGLLLMNQLNLAEWDTFSKEVSVGVFILVYRANNKVDSVNFDEPAFDLMRRVVYADDKQIRGSLTLDAGIDQDDPRLEITVWAL